MIISFIHKGLEKFYSGHRTSGIQAKHASRLRLILSNLDQAESPDDMDLSIASAKGQTKRHMVGIRQWKLAGHL